MFYFASPTPGQDGKRKRKRKLKPVCGWIFVAFVVVAVVDDMAPVVVVVAVKAAC